MGKAYKPSMGTSNSKRVEGIRVGWLLHGKVANLTDEEIG